MKIAVDARSANREKVSGGGIYLKNLLRGIAQLDSKNDYLLFIDSELNNSFPVQKENFQTKTLKSAIAWTQLRLPHALFAHRPDVYFSPHHWLPALTPKCRKVVTIHDLSFLKYPQYFGLKTSLYFKMSTYHAVKAADKIITISHNSKKDLLHHYSVDEKKIKVIHLGCDEIFHFPLDDAQSQKILVKYQIGNKYIFFLGDLHLRKNVDRLIKAFEQVKKKKKTEHKLVITGKKDWLSQQIYNLIGNSKVKDEIILTGYVPREVLPYLMGNAEMFVFPSLFEGFGMPLLEAMAARTPIITSNTTSMPEIAGDAAILVNPQSIDEIANAIEQLLENESLREDLVQKGSHQVKKFSWQKTARETLNLLCQN